MRAAGVLVAAACVALAANSVMATTVYTSEAPFTAQLVPGYYLEDFNYAPWTTIVDPAIPTPQSFASGVWAYQISSASGLSGQPIPPPNGAGGAVANYKQGEALTVTFTGELPRAVGGIFWMTDINGNFVSGATVTIKLVSGGTYTYSDTSNWDAFTGFVSDVPITSMTLSSTRFSTMDHLYVGNPVPEPLTMVSGFLAISGLGVYLRKRTRV